MSKLTCRHLGSPSAVGEGVWGDGCPAHEDEHTGHPQKTFHRAIGKNEKSEMDRHHRQSTVCAHCSTRLPGRCQHGAQDKGTAEAMGTGSPGSKCKRRPHLWLAQTLKPRTTPTASGGPGVLPPGNPGLPSTTSSVTLGKSLNLSELQSSSVKGEEKRATVRNK